MTSSPKLPEPERRPRHVAIIMDGNGRWAKDLGLPRLEGHRRGADVVRKITTFAREIGIEYLTLYSFSAQNWRRPVEEVEGLMSLLEEYCLRERDELMRNDIRLRTIGDLSRLPSRTHQAVQDLMQATRNNRSMCLTLALNYGGREELVAAARGMAALVARGELDPNDITEATVAEFLSDPTLPDPDLIIRTSGERRLSNFLLWQLAYAEVHFSDVRWPEFGRKDFARVLWDYATRDRRFGGLSGPASIHGSGSNGNGNGNGHRRTRAAPLLAVNGPGVSTSNATEAPGAEEPNPCS